MIVQQVGEDKNLEQIYINQCIPFYRQQHLPSFCVAKFSARNRQIEVFVVFSALKDRGTEHWLPETIWCEQSMFTVAFQQKMSAITLGTFWLLLLYILVTIADVHFLTYLCHPVWGIGGH